MGRTAFVGPRMVAVSVLAMTAAFGLNFAAGVFLAPLAATHGWGVGALSAAAAANTAVAGVLQPVVGALVDRLGPRVVLTVSLGLLAASYVALSAVDQLWQFLLVYPLLGGAGFAGAATFTNSVLISRWYVHARTAMLARTALGINLGQLLFLPLTGWLIATCDPGAAYLVLGLLVLLTVVPAAGLLVRDSPAELDQQPDGGAPAAAPCLARGRLTPGPAPAVRSRCGLVRPARPEPLTRGSVPAPPRHRSRRRCRGRWPGAGRGRRGQRGDHARGRAADRAAGASAPAPAAARAARGGRSSGRTGHGRTCGICPTPSCTSSTPATSPWRPTARRSPS